MVPISSRASEIREIRKENPVLLHSVESVNRNRGRFRNSGSDAKIFATFLTQSALDVPDSLHIEWVQLQSFEF